MKTFSLTLTVLAAVFFLSACQMKNEDLEKNKDTMEKIMKAFEKGNADALDALVAVDVVDHTPDPSMKGTGLKAVKEMCVSMYAAFPDTKMHIHRMVAEGDLVMAHFNQTGTNTGSMHGMPPTNKKIKMEGVDIVRIKDGKVTEHWGVYDNLEMMKQLGMVHMGHAETKEKMTEEKVIKEPKTEKKVIKEPKY